MKFFRKKDNVDKYIQKSMRDKSGNKYICMRMSDTIMRALTLEELKKQTDFRLVEDVPLEIWFEDCQEGTLDYERSRLFREDCIRINTKHRRSEIEK